MADAVRDGIWFLEGGGRMAGRIRDHDWSATPLGPLAAWPPSLKMVVSAILNSHFPKCITWGPELITIYNDAFRPILGKKPEALGRSFKNTWAEVWDDVAPIVDRAYAGQATFIEDLPLVVDRFGYPEHAWFTFCYSPIRDEHGRIVGMMDTVIETTGKVLAERNARLLNDELAHRIKNLLAMVSAIVNQTFRGAGSKAEAEAALTRRIAALGHAHDRLRASVAGRAPVRAVIEGVIAPYRMGQGRFMIEGPEVELGSRQAMAFALAINELATNALKYGALSNDCGRVRVIWDGGPPEADHPFRLRWEETGGPAVTRPNRRGFGSRLIEQVLADSLGGTAKLAFDAGGIRFELATTMRRLVA